MINFILSGGSGTRLWPISRTLFPKQFVKLFDNHSLFQKTVIRNAKFSKIQFIISNQEHFFLASDQIEELNIKKGLKYLLEPIGRNTAPAIALACFLLDEEDIVLITPSDHLIKNLEEYYKVVSLAKEQAMDNYIITFGIKPTSPETGYGYIEAETKEKVSKVKKFHEKPDKTTAESYLKKGNFYWNSGMFCFKVKVYLEELKKYSPEIYENSKKAIENAIKQDSNIYRIKIDDMLNIPSNSIDYAVMEKTDKAIVIPCDIGWSDMGSFESLYNELSKDSSKNAYLNTEPILLNSKNNLFVGEKRKIAAIDIEDLIVVDTSDALLLVKKGSAQKVKEIVNILKEKKFSLHELHLTVHRPWGSYTILETGKFYKVKKIVVKPGKRLSLQKHFHRNEHWIVVSGTALVTVGDEQKILRPNESTYIQMGIPHRLENPGKIPLIIIEAQVGEYVEEDDIVRLEDDFKRNEY